MDAGKSLVWIIDFGSQYTQLIARKCREIGYSSLLLTLEEAEKLMAKKTYPSALVLSGGPQSVFNDLTDYSFLFANPHISILGICYGMQIIAKHFGGKIEKGQQGEYGHAQVELISPYVVESCPPKFNVWMSHADHVIDMPENFSAIMKGENGFLAGMMSSEGKRNILGLQFHPEVEHTQFGKDLLSNFFQTHCKLLNDWNASTMLDDAMVPISALKEEKVLCAFSGGVDSLVAACMAQKVIKGNLYCFFVDNGLLRPQDHYHIKELQNKLELNIEIIDAAKLFLDKLKGVSAPEEKRKIIGRTFIEVFEQKVHEFEDKHNIKFSYLLQGTLYPDVIESISPHQKGGKSVTIKSHHNVGGLPERMKLKLLEPLRYLFKDEVRAIGAQLQLPHEWVWRHPFPGPGIGVRVLGELTAARIDKVQKSDQILFEELKRMNFYSKTWQAFTVLLPVKTVGVKGDGRAYEEVICLRMVDSSDGMTAKFSRPSFDFLSRVASRITNEVGGITRVVYDITSKPPGTIEWE